MPGRILIVEDTPTNRLILRQRLTNAYYDVLEAENGYQALDIAKSEEPDLILLDVMMPGMDGFEVCQRLKSDGTTMHIPVVMLTALDKREDRVKGIEAGADDFLSKPFEDVALMSRVDSLTRMKMMIDELALRGQTSSEFGAGKMMDASRTTTFPDSDVLIVSGSEEQGRKLREHLTREIQCKVELATNSEDAQALIDFIGFDAVLIDDALVDGDPLRFGTMIRARPETRQAATLLVVGANDLSLATRALELGFSDYITSPIDVLELTARMRSQLRRKNYSDQLRENMRKSMVQAVTDSLTGTYNRRYANTHLDALIDSCRSKSAELAVMVLDLDRFKAVNDTYGHAAGDSVLREFARRLQQNVRSMDLVARMGGEEFMVIMPEVNPALAAEITERVRGATADPEFLISGPGEPEQMLAVTVSIGYAVLTDKESSLEVVKRADEALYISKNGGRNMVTLAAA